MRKKLSCKALAALVFCFSLFLLNAEDGADGFGFEASESSDDKFTVNIGGKLSTGVTIIFDSLKNSESIRPASLIWGNLYLEAKAPLTEAYFGVNLNGTALGIGSNRPLISHKPVIPAWIDQAYMQMLAGPVVFGGGIKKITWGRADLFSVLDIVNPMDHSSMTEFDPANLKIAQPMFYLSSYLPHEMKIEAVFLPMFAPHRYALSGRWKNAVFAANLNAETEADLKAAFSTDTASLKYAHGGGRFTVTLAGNHDLGFQYFYGYLFDAIVNGNGKAVYNPYHNVGIDYGTVIGPVNIRAELAAAITSDLKGSDPFVQNPFLAWNAGFEYAAPRGFTVGAQVSETIRLKQDSVGSIDSTDNEKGKKQTDTKLILTLSQALVRRSLELKLLGIAGIEDADFLIAPSVHWQFGTLLMDCSLGFFGGRKTGKFGQYAKNNFIKLSIGYQF